MNELATVPNGLPSAQVIEKVLLQGDLNQLSPDQRVSYYKSVCESLGLNPLTKPFDYIVLNDRLTLYAKRDCTDQLRKIHGISVKIVSRELVDGVYTVTSQATDKDGREDESIGAVPLVKENGSWQSSQSGKRFFKGDGTYNPLPPDDKANAMMKAETKAKRRVTLSICGLGMLDETELDTIPGVRNIDTGGHAIGTAAAATHVGQQKIEQLKKQQEPETTTSPTPPDNTPPALTGVEELYSRITSPKSTIQVLENIRLEYQALLNDDDAEFFKIGQNAFRNGIQDALMKTDDIKGRTKAEVKHIVKTLYEHLQKIRSNIQGEMFTTEEEPAGYGVD